MRAQGTMSPRRLIARNRSAALVAASLLVATVALTGCDYIVPPIDFSTATPALADNGWAGVATSVSESSGSLHVDVSIVNNTNDWSAMDVSATSARVEDASGSNHDCKTVYVGTSVFVNDGAWYLPPGFVMKGYTGGTLREPKTQPLYVECSGVSPASGQKLSIDYKYITGAFNYYVPSKARKATMKVDLDQLAPDTTYPIAEQVSQLQIATLGEAIPAINGCSVKLVDAQRTDTGLELFWESDDPGAAATYIHIGKPPVLGSDGNLYGYYQSPHLTEPPVTPAGGDTEWTTTVTVPADVTGLYVLVPVESQQQKYFIDHVVDITDK
jgi:hypothetical protein